MRNLSHCKTKVLPFTGIALFVCALIAPVANALPIGTFGAIASGNVSGNCRTDQSSYLNGGTFFAAILGSTTNVGLTTTCGGYPPGAWTGTASSFASLGSGELKTFVSVTSPVPSIPLGGLFFGAPYNVEANATAQLTDTIQIFGPPFDTLSVLLTLEVEGNPAAAIIQNDSLHAGTMMNLRLDSARNCFGDGGGFGFFSLFCPFQFPLKVQVVRTVSSSNPFLIFTSELNVRAINNATVDLSDTALLSIRLPDGYTFESASGVLLTEPPGDGASVPEPGSLLLTGTSLFTFVGVRWWRNRRMSKPLSAEKRTSVA